VNRAALGLKTRCFPKAGHGNLLMVSTALNRRTCSLGHPSRLYTRLPRGVTITVTESRISPQLLGDRETLVGY
jgi:hypothetical protein